MSGLIPLYNFSQTIKHSKKNNLQAILSNREIKTNDNIKKFIQFIHDLTFFYRPTFELDDSNALVIEIDQTCEFSKKTVEEYFSLTLINEGMLSYVFRIEKETWKNISIPDNLPQIQIKWPPKNVDEINSKAKIIQRHVEKFFQHGMFFYLEEETLDFIIEVSYGKAAEVTEHIKEKLNIAAIENNNFIRIKKEDLIKFSNSVCVNLEEITNEIQQIKIESNFMTINRIATISEEDKEQLITKQSKDDNSYSKISDNLSKTPKHLIEKKERPKLTFMSEINVKYKNNIQYLNQLLDVGLERDVPCELSFIQEDDAICMFFDRTFKNSLVNFFNDKWQLSYKHEEIEEHITFTLTQVEKFKRSALESLALSLNLTCKWSEKEVIVSGNLPELMQFSDKFSENEKIRIALIECTELVKISNGEFKIPNDLYLLYETVSKSANKNEKTSITPFLYKNEKNSLTPFLSKNFISVETPSFETPLLTRKN